MGITTGGGRGSSNQHNIDKWLIFWRPPQQETTYIFHSAHERSQRCALYTRTNTCSVASLTERLGDILSDVSQTTDWADDDREDAPKPATNTDKNVKEGGKENEKEESGSGSQGPLHESKYDVQAVSYTHLTLPTIYSV